MTIVIIIQILPIIVLYVSRYFVYGSKVVVIIVSSGWLLFSNRILCKARRQWGESLKGSSSLVQLTPPQAWSISGEKVWHQPCEIQSLYTSLVRPRRRGGSRAKWLILESTAFPSRWTKPVICEPPPPPAGTVSGLQLFDGWIKRSSGISQTCCSACCRTW